MKREVNIDGMMVCLILCSIILFAGCKENSTQPESSDAINYDYSYIAHYRSDFDISKFSVINENKHSRLRIIPNYMNDAELKKLGANVDTMINRICTYLNTNIEKEYNGFKGKVSYFIEPGIIPRCYGGSSIPIVSITNDASLASMYEHETVHIFSMNTTSTWLIEGLAVHTADTLSVEKLWPNYSENLHKHAKRFINNIFYKDALNYIGVNGFYGVDPTTYTGEAFYTLSGSFIRYLIQKLGKSNFMKCYSSADFKSALYLASQKSFDDWEKEWLNYLTILEY
jgi:hypothetical protein